MGSQQFCLKWKSHYSNLLSALDQLLFSESFTDVTLACEGLSLKAHRAMLSACSPFFQALFAENQCQHPIVILKDFKFSELRAIVDFMYHGEVNVSREQLSSLLKAAEALQVKGLTDLTSDSSELAEQLPSLTSSEVRASTADSASIASPSKRPLKSPPSSKRKRVRPRHVTPREQESQVSSNDEVEEDNSSEEEPSPKCSAEVPGTQRTTRSSKSSSSGSVLESLLSSKELSSCDQRRRLHASADATEDEKDFETSRLLEQALAKGDESNASIADDNCHQKMFPASSQLSLLATAKMLESGTGAKPEAEGDASTLLATLATSGESSAPGNGSGQARSFTTAEASHSLFPARGGRNSGWTEEQMQRALSAVFAEGVPMTAAARRFGIPKTTLLYRLQNSLTRRSPKT